MDPSRHAGTAYVVTPESGTGPGVLVLHAWWGSTPFFHGVADRLADAGFVALAPDLTEGRTASTPDDAQAMSASIDPNGTANLVLSSVSALGSMPATSGARIGIVGFSMGASWGLWASARAPELVGAVAAFYGTTDVDFAPSSAAYQVHLAEFDEFVSVDEAAEMEAHLRLVERPLEVHRYPGTAHWFVEEDQPVAYSPDAAAVAWGRVVAFLRAELDTSGG